MTPRQWEVLRHRAKGSTQSEVAKKLNISREDVSIIEHRAWSKINAAVTTMEALREMRPQTKVVIPAGASVYEAVNMFIRRADILDVKLRISSDDVLALLRSKCRGKIRGHHLVSAVAAEIRSDGSLRFETAT